MSFQCAFVRVGIQVTRQDSEWIPFEYRMFWCKQQGQHEDPRYISDAEWAQEMVGMLNVLGGVPGEYKMKVGESRRYWATLRLSAWSDSMGEWDENVEFLKVRRAK